MRRCIRRSRWRRLRAGVNVLCEKPLALDLERADRMRAACAAAGVQLAVSHQFRFTPLFRQAKQWIAAGRIGELRAIREVGKGRPAGFELMEMGVHYFDEMEFFLDGIEWVHAQVSYEGRAVGVEDIMPSRRLCPTDRRDNGLVAGDTMLVHLGSPHGAYGLMELYVRGSVHDWLMGPHLLGSEGQLMIKPHRGVDELWYCPSDVSFAAHTPPWERVARADQDGLSHQRHGVADAAFDLERPRYGRGRPHRPCPGAGRGAGTHVAGVRERRTRIALHRRADHPADGGSPASAGEAAGAEMTGVGSFSERIGPNPRPLP